MPSPRVRRVETKKQFDQAKEDYHVQGYELLNDGNNQALFRKKASGSVPIHVILFILTIGIGNALYWWYAKSNAEQVLLKWENVD